MTTTHNPQRLLVTGGAGFIGTNFVHYWLEQYPDTHIVVLDVLTYAGRSENLQAHEGTSNFRFVQGDILDQGLVTTLLHEETIDTIVHFAAESHVDRSIYEPDAFLKTNIDGVDHDRRYAIDNKKTSNKIFFKPEVNFYEGLSRTLNWNLKNKP